MVAPLDGSRLVEARGFRLDAGGAESNVAVHVASLGHRAAWFSRLGADALGAPVPIIAGEFHYWRVNPLYWERILDRYVEAEVPMVSTFICWDAHERERGGFDFEGRTDPALDLPRFLDLCAERGLRVLVRVGPIIDAFWPTRGPAADVAQLERFEPEYRDRTREYFDHLLPIVVPRQLSRGGNVAMVCLDNEVYYPYATVRGEPTPQPFDKIEVFYREEFVHNRYREWLRARFGDIAALNAHAGTAFTDFSAVSKPSFSSDPAVMTRLAFEHIDDSVVENFAWLRGQMQDRGIEVPMYCNLRLYSEFIDWGRVDDTIESAGNQSFTTRLAEGEHAYVITWSHLLHRARTKFPWNAEHQAGMCFGLGEMDAVYGMLPPEHYRYAGHLAAAMGARGASLTMFVECDWWHWSPITPLGDVRPGYHEAVTDFLGTLGETAADERLADIGLLWCPEEHRDFVTSRHESWETLQEQVDSVAEPKEWPGWWSTFTRLVDDDVDFDLVVPGRARSARLTALVVAGTRRIGLAALETLVEHARAGGTVIVTTELPQAIHPAGPKAEARAQELFQELAAASDRVRRATPGEIFGLAASEGARSYARSDSPGIRTYAYARDGVEELWVVNTGSRDVRTTVALASAPAGLHEFSRNRQLGDALAPPELGDATLAVTVPAKTVRAFRYAPETGA